MMKGGDGVIDGDVYVHKDYWGKRDIHEGDWVEVLLSEYKGRSEFKFFGKKVNWKAQPQNHRQQQQISRGSSSRASPPPVRERRRESPEDDRCVRKDEARREAGGSPRKRLNISAKKEPGVWYRGKVRTM